MLIIPAHVRDEPYAVGLWRTLPQDLAGGGGGGADLAGGGDCGSIVDFAGRWASGVYRGGGR